MELEIYRIADKDTSGFKHNEVCRACAKEFSEKGFEIEFDKHLSKYMYNDDGISYYMDGENDVEITCSKCNGSFEGLENELLLVDELSNNDNSLFDKSLLEKTIITVKYVIGVDTYDKDVFAYCFGRKVEGVFEIMLSKTMSDEKEFKQEVESLSKYFNADVFLNGNL